MSMSVKSITDVVLHELKQTGIKERTIAHNYDCFYKALCKDEAEKELDERMVLFFLEKHYGKNILLIPNSQLKRHEQTCKNAFRTLLNYLKTEKLGTQYKSNGILPTEEEILDQYIDFCTDDGNKPKTLKRKRDTLRRFLSTHSLQSINVSGIQEYIQSFIGKSPYYLKRELDEIKKFVAYCNNCNFIQQNHEYVFPNIKAVKDSKIPSVFTKDEIKKMLSYFSARNTENRLRDYSMVLLMSVYGFRSIDISNFDCGCLDFKAKIILLSQSKTDKVICHRILPHVGNVIVDYILQERPESSSTLLFLKKDGNGLSPKSVSSVVRNGFLSCGIDIGKRKYGSHSLRHSLGSSLINDGYSIFTVANVLGQTSIETARLYAKVDLNRLSLCALEVPSNE